jgi:hypothetical protein
LQIPTPYYLRTPARKDDKGTPRADAPVTPSLESSPS